MNDISKNANKYKSNLRESELVIQILEILAEALIKQNMAQNLIQHMTNYMSMEVYNLSKNNCDEILSLIFDFLATNKSFGEGLEFFITFRDMFKVSNYSPIKAFIFYFAYYMKDYSKIDKLLYNFTISDLDIKHSNDYRIYCLYCYYKGLIHLQKREFEFAAFSFLSSIVLTRFDRFKIIEWTQWEGFRKLVLITPFLNDQFRRFMEDKLNGLEKLRKIDDFKVYYDLYTSMTKVISEAPTNMAKFLVEQEKELKESGNFGLANFSLIELRFKLIVNELKKYKRILLNKFCNKINLSAEIVRDILEMYSAQGKIAVKFDEDSTIIEVINCELDSERKLEELKKYYGLLNEATLNWTLLDLAEINSTKKEKKGVAQEFDFTEDVLMNG